MRPASATVEAPPGHGERRGADAATTLFEELFARHERRLGKFLAQMVSDRSLAEDLLQDTFHDAFSARSQMGGIHNPEAWLFGIARNRALNALRKRRRFHLAVDRLIRAPARNEAADHELLVLRDLLERHLEPDERTLLLLRYLHGFDAAELGAMTDCTPAAIRQRLSRATTKLIAAAEAGSLKQTPTRAPKKEEEQ
jgi:RNA polymerase sigma-70 factor, ECF subfamily